ncbi:pilus assembly protein TadE [Streptomyces tateyamensis]|uniref:Pilus assembly protein TadE n=1 Tax=Streptomyces tateyamensis TaxID=565073 RepID=A0A2V4N4I8_9ACTN|nr:TadE/TadG family type IV pilus assembly protein [Streptomyces tateyamensis]PYC65575.1 pilus assembly protein TadE [Streptomyces tateyamensis]
MLLRRHLPHERDRGAATPELALAAPLLLLVLMAVVQFALAVHAHHIAQAAAARALATARAERATAEQGRADGQAFLGQVGSATLTSPKLAVHRGAAEASVDVSGGVVHVVPFLDLHVRAHASGPVEHLTSPNH